MAATTGYLRMYNNKHWFSDVVAGAGVEYCSTRTGLLAIPDHTKGVVQTTKSTGDHAYLPGWSSGISFVYDFKRQLAIWAQGNEKDYLKASTGSSPAGQDKLDIRLLF